MMFEAFWKLYPRKVGKFAAQKSWKKLTSQQRQEILDHLPERIKTDRQWLKNNGEFIPHPTTFLNQGRWMDEYDAEKISSKPKRNYNLFADNTLLDFCREKNITTHGRTREQLISALKKLDA